MIAVAATIAWGVLSLKEQANLKNFRLEAAKTVMTTKNLGEAISKATFLRENFPEQLGNGFLSKLDQKTFPDAPNVAAKWDFMQYIAPRGLTPVQAQGAIPPLIPG